MSTKNIALSTQVYERLARYKRESESFSRAIDRLLAIAQSRHAGSDILKALEDFPSLSEGDARRMQEVVERHRAAEMWDRNDLR